MRVIGIPQDDAPVDLPTATSSSPQQRDASGMPARTEGSRAAINCWEPCQAPRRPAYHQPGRAVGGDRQLLFGETRRG